MTIPETIDRALSLAGISGRELSQRLGHKSDSAVQRWRRGKTGLGLEKFAEILRATGLSGGWSPIGGYWVCRPEEIRLPSEGE